MLPLLVLLVLNDWTPRHTEIRPDQLPRPYATPSAKMSPRMIRGRGDAPIKLPPGFRAEVFARGLMSPRKLAVAENGDVFVVESYQGKVRILRDEDGDGRAERRFLFSQGHRLPYGIALHDDYLYVANTNSVVRFPYRTGQTAAGKGQTVVTGIPSRGYRQHWTRNLVFSPDGRWMYLTVGSETDKSPEPPPRGTILRFNPDGRDRRVYASGLRNAVGLAFRPGTNELWTTGMERDFYGDDLVPEFATRVSEGDFFGWPWFYIGNHRDPFLAGRPAPKRAVRVPDVLLTAHSVPLGLAFYDGSMFPPEYRGDAFIAMRGSNNRRRMSGYRLVRVDFRNGVRAPGFDDFAVGWCPDERKRDVYGRPVDVAVARDGALLVADEAGHCIWRISYRG